VTARRRAHACTSGAEHWATEELPGIAWDPDAEPPDDVDEPRIETVTVTGDLL
jgi:hypothetical protein